MSLIGTKWKDHGGDFTMYKYLAESGRAELEDKLGYHKGRLGKGAMVCVMFSENLASLTAGDFTLGASTRWSRSAAAAPWAPHFMQPLSAVPGEAVQRMEPNAIEGALSLRGQDVTVLKNKVLAFFRTGDGNLPAKVFPLWDHEDWMTYPGAEAGVPQFQLQKSVSWIVKRIV